MPVSKKTTKNMELKRKQACVKRSAFLSSIGCGVVISSLGSHAQCSAFTAPSMTVKSRLQNDERSTQVWYRNGDENDSPQMLLDHDKAASSLGASRQSWSLNSILPKRKNENIDEYLQFIDRRYNRLHSDETKGFNSNHQDTIRTRVNAALKWVLEERGLNPRKVPNSVQDDALYVLGLAEAAGSSLLKQHQLRDSTKPQIAIAQDGSHEDDIAEVKSLAVNNDQTRITRNLLHKILISGTKVYKTLQERKSALVSTKISAISRLSLRSTFILVNKVLFLLQSQVNFMKRQVKVASTMTLSLVAFLILYPLKLHQ